MDTISTLLWTDRIAITKWFSKDKTGKYSVLFLFFIVFTLVAIALFSISGIFFRMLASYDTFGMTTAGYLIHAAILIIIVLATGSSIASSGAFLLSPDAETAFLLTQPVIRKKIALYALIKTVFADLFLISFIFIPVLSAYAKAFVAFSAAFIVQSMFALIQIIVVTSVLGMTGALAVITVVKRYGLPAIGVGLFGFLAILFILIRVIFPPSIGALYTATPEQFSRVFLSLPLNNAAIPTFWLADMITKGFSNLSILSLLLTGSVCFICLRFITDTFARSVITVRSTRQSSRLSLYWIKHLRTTRSPIAYKDILSVLRTPSELGYGMFLVSVAVLFFAFLIPGASGNPRLAVWNTELTVFSFGWLMFFQTAYALRFLFPLMGAEGKHAWYVFTMPLTKRSILHAKLSGAFWSAVPFSLLSIAVWYLLPFTSKYAVFVTAVSVITIFSLSAMQTLMGTMFPDFSKRNTPEKASTSTAGIVTLILSILMSAWSAILIYNHMSSVIGGIEAITVISVPMVLLCVALETAARKRMMRYSL